jgi:hypothetical protein
MKINWINVILMNLTAIVFHYAQFWLLDLTSPFVSGLIFGAVWAIATNNSKYEIFTLKELSK